VLVASDGGFSPGTMRPTYSANWQPLTIMFWMPKFISR
jgi:hypothetical protein